MRKLAEPARDHDVERDLDIEERNVELRLTNAVARGSSDVLRIIGKRNRNILLACRGAVNFVPQWARTI
jgi:hypothetical protein